MDTDRIISLGTKVQEIETSVRLLDSMAGQTAMRVALSAKDKYVTVLLLDPSACATVHELLMTACKDEFRATEKLLKAAVCND